MTHPTRPTSSRRLSGDEGMVTAFVVVMMFALLLLAGLVLDGGLTLAAHVQAIDEAQAAARAGAQQIDLATYRTTGAEVLDPAAATTAADSYLAVTGHTGTVTVTGDEVTVTVRITQPTQILSIAGIKAFTVSGTGTAVAERGITGAGT